MKITAITAQTKNQSRVNIMVDGKYRFSLDIFQVGELGIRVGKEYTDEELNALEEESIFGKTYARTLEYTLIRPHSAKEIRDYLWRKTRTIRSRNRRTGELAEKKGISPAIADRVFDRLKEKGYVDDEKFARWWVENRNQRKGTSLRRLEAELRGKGVPATIIQEVMNTTTRDDLLELEKMIEKKARKYDEQKLVAYLLRQGFSYEDVRTAMARRITED